MGLFDSITNNIGNRVTGIVQDRVAGAVNGAINGAIGSAGSVLSGVLGAGGGIPNPFGSSDAGSSGGSNAPTPLKEFFADIQARGIAYPNRFYCNFSFPPIIQDILAVYGDAHQIPAPQEMILRCDTAELPGVSYSASEYRPYGPILRSPNHVVYSDLNLSYLLSADLVEKYMFDYWMASIKDSSDLFEYQDQILTDITLTVFDQRNEAVYGVKFIDCWPIGIAPIQLSWADQELMKLNVTFAYERWKTVSFTSPPYAYSPDGISLGEITSGGSIRDFAFGLLPSLPGGANILGDIGMSAASMFRNGVSTAVSSTLRGAVRDPITNAIASSGVNTINSFLGGGPGG